MTDERILLRFTKITQVNPWVRCFRLETAHRMKRLPMFQAGQYINLFYEIEGATTSRPYSIASSPGDAASGFYELYIHGGGEFTSKWLFENGGIGQTIWASLPVGDFCHNPERDGRKIIGISGGMSVTPLCSMARAVAEGTLDIELTVFCGWDRQEEIILREELLQYEKACPRVHCVFAVAEQAPSWAEKGYVNLAMIRRHTDPKDAAFFLCGPAAMYTALAGELAPLGVPACRLHQELPGEAKRPFDQPDYPPCGANVFLLTVLRGEQRYRLPMDSGETVLVAMERAGISPPARCRSGQCGFCRSRLIQGSVFVPGGWKASDTKEEGDILHPCCSFPLTDLEIICD